jgi:hypothetical protein
MQFGRMEMRGEAVPDGDSEVLRGGKLGGELGHLLIEMAMVKVLKDVAAENVLEQFEVDDKTGNGIDFAGDGDFKGVVMAVAVEVGTLAEDALVLLGSPLRVVIIVGGGKLSLTGEIDHDRRSLATGTTVYFTAT